MIFDAKKEYEDAVTSWLKEFCGGTENSLAYRTKRDYLQEFGKMKQMYSIAGGALEFYSCPDRCAEFCQCNYDLDPVKKTGICDDGIHRNDRRAAEADFADGGLILCGHYHTDQRVVWNRDQLRCGKSCDCTDVDV